MPEQRTVAAPDLPGEVLDPNGEFNPEPDSTLETFGQELPKPTAGDAGKGNEQGDKEALRYQHHQARADKAEARLKELEAQLAQTQPLIEVLRTDEQLREMVSSHLSGKSSAKKEKPLEAPQKPSNYNEAEAYSAPESESYKYRVAHEQYREKRLESLEASLRERDQREQMMAQETQRQQAERTALQKFATEVMSMGVPQEELPEFMGMVNKPETKDLVEFYQFRKGRTSSPRFDVPGAPGYSERSIPRGNVDPRKPVDASNDILKQALQLR